MNCNSLLIEAIERELTGALPIKLGVNKRNELLRLIYEVCCRDGVTPLEVLERIGIADISADDKGAIFQSVKKHLLFLRYPSFLPESTVRLDSVNADKIDSDCRTWDFSLDPRVIFVENAVRGSVWVKSFLGNFPNAEVRGISSVKEGELAFRGMDPVSRYGGRRDNLFLVRNKESFIKICPCSRSCRSCAYWILDIGFGCPIDCSYCFLQSYSNSPGLILPANIEDYLARLDEFDKRAGKRTRIGTGEFTDSLALDRYTAYSSSLIPFFRKTKNLILELKTKVSDIGSVLNQEAHDNVVISWSVNAEDHAARYEKGAPPVADRLKAAVLAARKGYNVAFHFDPIIYSKNWKSLYKEAVENIFSHDILRKRTAWVSLGTLRYTPGLKQVAEQRFRDNLLFYNGDFFKDIDGKMRYPKEVRAEIYDNMINWIRRFRTGCWIYLCMETDDVWNMTSLSGFLAS